MALKSNIAEFNAVVSKFAATIPSKVTLLQKKIVLEALRKVVLKTPVDTGRARGGWQVTIDAPAMGQIDNLDKEGSTVVSAALAVLESLPPYSIVFISNNVKYIIFLEEGSSTQAPNGMVAVTIEELKAMFQ